MVQYVTNKRVMWKPEASSTYRRHEEDITCPAVQLLEPAILAYTVDKEKI